MCVACIEYQKDKLKIDEFRSALREMTVNDREHQEAVNRILSEFANDPNEIKRRLEKLAHAK